MRKSFNGLHNLAAKGRFSWPAPSEAGQSRIKLAPEARQLLIDGVDLRGAAFKPWYERPD